MTPGLPWETDPLAGSAPVPTNALSIAPPWANDPTINKQPQAPSVQPDTLNEYVQGSVPGARQMSGAAAVADHETKRAANAVTTAFGGNAPYPDEEQKNAGDVYRGALAQHDARREAFVDQKLPANPILRLPLEGMLNLPGLVGLAGPAVAGAAGPATAVLGGAGGPVTTGQAIKAGATLGGAAGLDASDLTHPGVAAVKTGIGAGTGGVIGLGSSAIAAPATGVVSDWFARKFGGQQAINNQAARMVIGRMQQDTAAGGPKAQDMIDLLNAGSTTPQAIVDVAGENTKALAGQLARRPGEARQYVIGTLNARDAGAQQRMVSGIDQNISPAGGASAYSTDKALMTARAAASKPAYDAAFEGGSIAPLQDQLRDELVAATGRKGAIQRQITAIEQNNPGALAARGAAGAQTRAQYMDLHQQLQQAESDRQAALGMFQRAQSDAASNAPGAIWSPRIQQFLDQPEVQQGIQRGLKIQRLESVGNGTPFSPTEYGITGTDADGNSIVSSVPNMRLLDAGKRGLDAMIGDHTDAVTGKVDEMGRALIIAKNGYVAELDRVNPLYKAARDAYSGPSASMNAMRLGQGFLDKSPEQITDELSNLGANDQEFYRLGQADTLRRSVMKTGKSGNEAGVLEKNPWLESQIKASFANPQDGENFFASVVRPEQRMFQTKTQTIGNSATAARVAEDANKPSIFQGIYQIGHGLGTGNIGALTEGAGTIGQAMGITARNPQVDLAAAKLLLNPDVIANRALILRAANARPPVSRIPLASLPAANLAARAYPALTSALSGTQSP